MIAADRDLNSTLDVLLAFYVGKIMLDLIELAEDGVRIDRNGPDRDISALLRALLNQQR